MNFKFLHYGKARWYYISADRIKSDPAFQRTRENGDEFGRAGAAGKLLRTAFRQFLQNGADNRMVGRLTKEMMAVVKADATNTRGQRNVLDGELELLEGFEFNIDGELSTVIYFPYSATIDRVTGALQAAIPAFSIANKVTVPEGATHMKLVSGGASIDFEGSTFEIVTSESAEIPILQDQVAALNLLNQLPASSTHPLFLVFGVTFSQQVNGVNYPLKTGIYNALALVKVLGL